MRATWMVVLVLGSSLGACAVGPAYRTPGSDLPESFTSVRDRPAAAGTAPDLANWWHSLDDPELDSLVDRAVRSNPDIEIALDRLQAARTYEATVAGIAPLEVDASGAAARGTGSDLSRSRAGQALVSADNAAGLAHINTLGGFDAVWQLDLFGKYRREAAAVRAEAEAARDARYGVLTAVIADVVRAYVDLRGLQIRNSILHRADSVLQESVRLVTLRYQRGITNELDVALATRELTTLDARLKPVEAAISAAQYSLAVLIGEYPEVLVEELSRPDLIPSMPAPVVTGAPIDLLKRRPDIRQAERELAAATARIGVATADLFPQLALVGSIGAQDQRGGATPVLGRHIWSLGPGAVWPLLDFGALDAAVDIAGLEAHESLVRYRKTIRIAVEQVDTSVDAFRAQQARVEDLGAAMIAAERAVELATQRYDRGLTDYLNVVDAERQLYELQEQYAEAQVSAGEAFVQLYRSLGGGWEGYQAVPAIRRPQPAVVAALRRLLDSPTP